MMEVELVAYSTAIQVYKRMFWFKRCLKCLEFSNDSKSQVKMHCKSSDVITYTESSKYHCNTKHIDIKYNYIREIVSPKKIAL